MRSRFLLFLIFLSILSCQFLPTPPPIKPTSIVWFTPSLGIQQSKTPSEAIRTTEATRDILLKITPSLTGVVTTSRSTPFSSGELPPFPSPLQQPFSSIEEIYWKPGNLSKTASFSLPISMDQVLNREVLAGLTSRQQSFLEENGFVVIHSKEAQFSELCERVSLRFGQPYYLTTDTAYHALSLTLDELFIALEREELMQTMVAITEAMLEQVYSYLPLVQGTNLENETKLAAAYLGVALRLFEPQTTLEPSLYQQTSDQIEQILAGGGVEDSVLIPNLVDDYEAYNPFGHYAGDEALEGYFRAMTWFERVHFDFQSQIPGFIPSRIPLILTLALRQGMTPDGSAAEEWNKIYEVLDFLFGSSYDLSPVDYSKIMDQVYGRRMTIISLTDEARWQNFQTLAPVLPSMHNRSQFLRKLEDLEVWRGWRLIGRRINLDDLIFLNMVFDRVGTDERMRELPSGLDLMATYDSTAAFKVLEKSGETSYTHYLEQLGVLQSEVMRFSEAQWFENASNSWMYAINPQLVTKDERYPPYMRTDAWSYKNLNSSLGGWADSRHDPNSPIQIAEMISEDGIQFENPPPGYVEPDPTVFYRLAYLANVIAEGLRKRGLVGIFSTNPLSLNNLLLEVLDLGDQFQRLGDIAIKELEGHPLDKNDLSLIYAPLGPAEERAWLNQKKSVSGYITSSGLPPIEGIQAWEGGSNRILQFGNGAVDRIYVIIPQDGKLQIAQGGVYSYYEFPQPRSWKLYDESWRQLLRLSPPDRPSWVDHFSQPGGNFVDVLFFRIGDIYMVSQTVANLSIHETPSRVSPVIQRLQPSETVTIVDGPIEAEGLIWWKFRLDIPDGQSVEGWAIENQDWYERVWRE